jgi:hypothetical protein
MNVAPFAWFWCSPENGGSIFRDFGEVTKALICFGFKTYAGKMLAFMNA